MRRLPVPLPALLVAVALVLGALTYAAWPRPSSPDDPLAGHSTALIGAPQGTRIATYAAQARARLAALKPDQRAYALVSLAAYRTPQQVVPVAAGVQVDQAYLRVPLPDVQTELVHFGVITLQRDLETGMRKAAVRMQAEATAAEQSARAQTGASDQQRRAFAEQSAGLLRRQARAMNGLCACVYGLVVRGTPAQLRALTARPDVRVVDPAPQVTLLQRAVFLPVLPEQRGVVSPPPDLGLPSPSHQPTPRASARS